MARGKAKNVQTPAPHVSRAQEEKAQDTHDHHSLHKTPVSLGEWRAKSGIARARREAPSQRTASMVHAHGHSPGRSLHNAEGIRERRRHTTQPAGFVAYT